MEIKLNNLHSLERLKAKKLLRGIALDLKIHKRVHFKVTRKVMIIKFERVMPSKVRYNKDASRFGLSDDWSTMPPKIYDEYDPTYA